MVRCWVQTLAVVDQLSVSFTCSGLRFPHFWACNDSTCFIGSEGFNEVMNARDALAQCPGANDGAPTICVVFVSIVISACVAPAGSEEHNGHCV